MGRRRLSLFLALICTALVASVASAQSPGVTDLSGASVTAIEVTDITEALAVPRGTRIEPSAPPTVRLPIYFEFSSAELRPDAKQLLSKVGAALTTDELESFQFSIEGHTDSVGGDGYNLSLSEQRAQSVKVYLIEEGVSEERLGSVGKGEVDPVADNDSDAGRQRNRRVELINLGTH